MSKRAQTVYVFTCDEDGCWVAATIRSEDALPIGWGEVGELHFCHHHAEAHEVQRPAVSSHE